MLAIWRGFNALWNKLVIIDLRDVCDLDSAGRQGFRYVGVGRK
jgi:hypothetical protein